MKHQILRSATLTPIRISVIILCSMALAAQSQVIDPLTGSLAGYTTTLVLDNSLGAGQGVSFSSSGSGLSANYAGTGTSAEQALFLAPVSSFATTFVVGDMLTVSASIPASSTLEDFGLAISSATPVAASAGNSYNSRPTFDWASISIRPSQNSIRVNSSISGTVNTSGGVIGIGSPTTVTGLYIAWLSTDVFNVGYVTTSGLVSDENITFNASSTIGADIGFYGDLRATGASLSSLSNLTIGPVPEPSTVALCGVGLAGWLGMRRRKVN